MPSLTMHKMPHQDSENKEDIMKYSSDEEQSNHDMDCSQEIERTLTDDGDDYLHESMQGFDKKTNNNINLSIA